MACSSSDTTTGSSGGSRTPIPTAPGESAEGKAGETVATGPGTLETEFTISSVALGNDCVPVKSKPDLKSEMARGKSNCAGDDCDKFRPCQPSSMQLALTTRGLGPAIKIEIVKVELLNADGTLLSELVPQDATKWVDAPSSYQAWDGLIAEPGELKVSYMLSAPDWSKVPGGSYSAGQRGGLSARVTMAVGEQRLIKTSTAVSILVDPLVKT